MSTMQRTVRWAASSTIAHVGFAFIVMGGWAVFANRAHPPSQALVSGLVQGTLSALLTLGLKKALEAMNARIAGAAAWIVPPVITALVILGVLVGAHLLAQTPEIATTIAFPYAVSTSYAFIYTWKLCRERNRANGTS